MSGPIKEKWAATGWETGILGYPTGDPVCGLAGGGCAQDFTMGSVHWSPATGAQIVWGAVRDRWSALGREAGRLGYPTGAEHCGLAGGGCFQDFQKGMIYTSPASGTWSVAAPIKDEWAATGWETGTLGYPTGEPVCGLTGRGCFQDFPKGMIYTSPATGT